MYGAGERRLLDLTAPPGVGGCTAGGAGAPLGSRGEVDDRIVTSFAELRKIVIQAIFSTDMELFRQHHDAMKRRAQMKTSTSSKKDGTKKEDPLSRKEKGGKIKREKSLLTGGFSF